MTKPASRSPDDSSADPLVEGLLDEAMVPLRGLVPPHALPRLREMLAEVLSTHPVAGDLLERLRPALVVASSAELPRGTGEDVAAEQQASSVGGGKR